MRQEAKDILVETLKDRYPQWSHSASLLKAVNDRLDPRFSTYELDSCLWGLIHEGKIRMASPNESRVTSIYQFIAIERETTHVVADE
jgi:hypothetical protein